MNDSSSYSKHGQSPQLVPEAGVERTASRSVVAVLDEISGVVKFDFKNKKAEKR